MTLELTIQSKRNDRQTERIRERGSPQGNMNKERKDLKSRDDMHKCR